MESKGFTFGYNWTDVKQEAHAKGFTVAKAMNMEVLNVIRGVVQQSNDKGIAFHTFQKLLEPELTKLGWWGRAWAKNEKGELLDENGKAWPLDAQGIPIIPDDAVPPQLGSARRLRTIYDTNLQQALNAGRYAAMMDAAEDAPWWQYISIIDGNQTALCDALHLKVYRYDDPFWQHYYPMNHFGCRARVRSLDDKQLKQYGITPSSSEGKLGKTEALLSTKTGEVAEVATIEINGVKYSPAPGFSYNVGQAAWQPDTDKYPYDVAVQYVKGVVTGPDFKRFFDAGGALKGQYPVAILTVEEMQSVKAKKQTVYLSDTSLAKNKANHPELGLGIYQLLPDIISAATLIIEKDGRYLVYIMSGKDLYFAVVKTDADKSLNFVQSLRKTSLPDAKREAALGRIVRNDLY